MKLYNEIMKLFLFFLCFVSLYSEDVPSTDKIDNTIQKEKKLKVQAEFRTENKFSFIVSRTDDPNKDSRVSFFPRNGFMLGFQWNLNSKLSLNTKLTLNQINDTTGFDFHRSFLFNPIYANEKNTNLILNPTLKYFLYGGLFIGFGGGRNFGSRTYKGTRFSNGGNILTSNGSEIYLPQETYHIEIKPYNFYSYTIGFDYFPEKSRGIFFGIEFQKSFIINEKQTRENYYTFDAPTLLSNKQANLDSFLFINTFAKLNPEAKNFMNPVPTVYIYWGFTF
jgi:hypothetical protein